MNGERIDTSTELADDVMRYIKEALDVSLDLRHRSDIQDIIDSTVLVNEETLNKMQCELDKSELMLETIEEKADRFADAMDYFLEDIKTDERRKEMHSPIKQFINR